MTRKRFIAGPLLVLLLLTGCFNDNAEPPPVISEPPSSVFSDIGTWHETNARTDGTNMTFPEPDAPSEPQYYEFDPPTRKWLNGDLMSITSSAGEIKGRKEAGITLQLKNEDIADQLAAAGASVTFKLTERTAAGEWLRTVTEQTKDFDSDYGLNYYLFSTNLPREENKHYFVSAEILVDGQAEDSQFTSIYVPTNQINADISLPKERYSSEGQLELTLKNTGSGTFYFGLDYFIERYDNGVWAWVPYGGDGIREIPAIAFSLGEGALWKETITYGNFPEGRYRVGKRVSYLEQNIPLSVEFLVE